MLYVSTRGNAPKLGFEEAMLAGLARDGGLYVPESWPQLSPDEIAAFAGLPYEEVALRVMRPYLGGAFGEAEFLDILARAYAGFDHPARCPLRQTGPNDWLLELFHGPTLAFKDVAMQLIGQMFEESLKRNDRRLTIVGATSGDTGSAAIEAFRGRAGVEVFILFPDGRVSEVQRRQMTTPAEANVHALAIDGDFDDAQARVKDMFNDHAFRDAVSLAGVNSINWARVLAQVVYYFTSAVALGAPHRPVSFTVPTGNFGDIFAGHVARRMGLPIDRLVIATNQNDILHRTLATGAHRRAAVHPSMSPSMDIQISSNFERLLFELYDREGPAVAASMEDLRRAGGFDLPQGALGKLREGFDSASASEEETGAAIAAAWHETGELVCPHTAVGLHAARLRRGDTKIPMIVLATAHAAKFPDAVEATTGQRPALPERMADLFDRPERLTRVRNDLAAIEAVVGGERVA
ncbi:threonine synthase [Amaricoccus sp.]|uniref:threonine synthase n=1 Tax=Amaricoccus sp. TaxID=1872485 RepID=UPI002C89ECCA|nr:threonine synthase [Amaricoccus sp.]HRW16304.1 threonine synthase [Amaricoccus sp.]